MESNSEKQTIEHIQKVSKLIKSIEDEIVNRRSTHDLSKLEEPEISAFDKYTPLLQKTEYGSNEYKSILNAMKPAIEHHYKNNRHHPEHFNNGIDEMNLVDLIELLCDWKAASERNKKRKS